MEKETGDDWWDLNTPEGTARPASSRPSHPTAGVREVERITSRKQVTPTRTAKAFNPLSREDLQLFRAFSSGDHHLGGFRNRDIRARLAGTIHLKAVRPQERRQSAKVSRILQRFHAHGLIAKIPHSRKGRVTKFGQRVMATSIQLRQPDFPRLMALAA